MEMVKLRAKLPSMWQKYNNYSVLKEKKSWVKPALYMTELIIQLFNITAKSRVETLDIMAKLRPESAFCVTELNALAAQ
jgi:hypothetical protein